jgi:hypothetical protein
MTVTPLKPETGEGYVIQNRGASKNHPSIVRRSIEFRASQYDRNNGGSDSLIISWRDVRKGQ